MNLFIGCSGLVVANLLCVQAQAQLSLLPSKGQEMISSYGYGVKA